ncbi:MAG: hypothetical protein HQK92_16830, partial [Nitrospirae bacterium]|nr:hypothetical protein [Nitrospirota bacterium]
MKKIITFIVLSTLFTTSVYAWQVNGGWGGVTSYSSSGGGGNTYNYSYFSDGESLTTDNITEGSNKLFFTNGRARAVLSAGTGIGYDSGTGIITATGGIGTWGSITGNITTQNDLAPWFRDRFVQYYNLQTLDNVTDVVITNPTNGQVLTYSSGNWINSTPSGAGAVTWGSISGTLSTQADLYSQLIQPGAITKVLFGDKTWQYLYYDNITGGGSLSAKDITFTGALSHSTTNGIAYFYGNKLYTENLVTDNVTEGFNKYWHDASVFSAITGKLYYDNITDSSTVHPFTDTYRNYLNQSVANTASPTFAGLTTNSFTTGTLYASAPVTFAGSITTPLSGYMKATPSG